MATGRMLQRKISKSHDVAALIERVESEMGRDHGAYAALLFTWCIAHVDVEGRMHGDPRIVRSEVFPLLETVTTGHVTEYLRHIAGVGLAVWYHGPDGRKWLAFPGFDGSQPGLRKDREQKSTIPSPDQCTTVNAGVTPELLRQPSGITPSEVEEKRKEEKEKGARQNSADLGVPDNAKQRKTVDAWEVQARAILSRLNEARRRAIRGARDILPKYTSLIGIAGRLAAGHSHEECMHVIAVYESEVSAGGDPQYFDAVSPWRSENFTRALAKTPKNGKPNLVPARPPLVDDIGFKDEP